MILERSVQEKDEALLRTSLASDQYHQNTPAEFFVAPGTVCNVYEDEAGVVLFVRGAKALRLDVHFVDSEDTERNETALLEGVAALITRARENGFTEIIFRTPSRDLADFAKRYGFTESNGELTRAL